MLLLQDDATILSAMEDGTVSAVLDKGLLDALFCDDGFQQCHDVMKSVHRVLKADSVFCCLSFSRPEFILQKLMLPPDMNHQNKQHVQQVLKMWSHVEVRQLDYIYLYRFTKAKPTTPQRINIRKPSGGGRQKR